MFHWMPEKVQALYAFANSISRSAEAIRRELRHAELLTRLCTVWKIWSMTVTRTWLFASPANPSMSHAGILSLSASAVMRVTPRQRSDFLFSLLGQLMMTAQSTSSSIGAGEKHHVKYRGIYSSPKT